VDTIANAEEFDRIINKLDVLSRSRPEDKYALVVGLIERGNVVAVTGDGNLNNSLIIFKELMMLLLSKKLMLDSQWEFKVNYFIIGTQVARDACDIILLDDNFNSIIKAIMWGRNVYDSIKKFL
jgi:Ca2+ transporting ATPase